jgi:hypothetical protein
LGGVSFSFSFREEGDGGVRVLDNGPHGSFEIWGGNVESVGSLLPRGVGRFSAVLDLDFFAGARREGGICGIGHIRQGGGVICSL